MPSSTERLVVVFASLSIAGVIAGCGDKTPPPTTPPPGETAQPPAPPAAPTWPLDKVSNLGRLDGLTDLHRARLAENGFFLAPQPAAAAEESDQPRAPLKQATHLFHVYERNDYIAFPSLITADVAVDATHAYFDSVMREIEQRHLVPRLDQALVALVAEAERLRAGARTAEGRAEARRILTFYGVALHLLRSPAVGDAPDVETVVDAAAAYYEDDDDDRPAPPPPPKARKPLPATEVPKPIRRDVEAVTRAVQSASGKLPLPIVRARLDLTQMRPRGHYRRNGILERYFRAMSWLGMAAFPVTGDHADLPGIALLTRAWLGVPKAQELLGQVLSITTFFAGGPDAAGLEAAADRLLAVRPHAERAGADELVAEPLLAALAAKLAELPPPRIQQTGTGTEPVQIRVMGRRAFEDTVAMQAMVPPLRAVVQPGHEGAILPPLFGALGAAAALGSDLASERAVAGVDADHRPTMVGTIEQARRVIDEVPAERWNDDGYHGTLHALRALLVPPAETAPPLIRTAAWQLHQLQTFSAGWAELRHDTILYGEQLGVECDAPNPEPPPGWVEPVPAVYRRLGDMVRELDLRLSQAGITGESKEDPDNYYYRPLPEKATILLGLLDFLRDTAEAELAGKPLTRDQRQKITLFGGHVEWLLISLADTDLLSRRDQDMAVVADVFTWRPSGQVVEVGVGRPDLMYAIIPGPDGPVLARGAVMSYRSFLAPMDKRLGDEEWRARIDAGTAPPRPAWLEPIYAPSIPAIKLKDEGVSRCGPMSGASIEL